MKLKTLGANQTQVIALNGVTLLFSYDTPVAMLKDGKFYYSDTKHSNTTSRHISKWIGNVECEKIAQAVLDAAAQSI